MSYKHLDRPAVLKRLRTYRPYDTMSLKKIETQLGNNVASFRKELERLDNSYNRFDQFSNLPPDLQAVILSENKQALSKSPRISKILKNSPTVNNTYYHQFCNNPITFDEIKIYLKYVNPSKILFEEHGKMQMEILNRINNNNIQNNYFRHYLYVNNNLRACYPGKINGGKVTMNNIMKKEKDISIDLKNMYYIYKMRQCESIKPGYSKTKVKEFLNLYHDIKYSHTYAILLSTFLYLRENLKLFNQSVPDNVYKYCDVDVNNETTT